MPPLLPVLAALAIALSAVPALAQEHEPDEASLEAARQLLEAGKAGEALEALEPLPLRGPGSCIYGAALEQESQPARALLYLERCHRIEPSPELRTRIRSLRQKLRKQSLAPVSLSLSPSTATAKLSEHYTQDTLLADDELWLAMGTYRIDVAAPGYESAAYAVKVESTDRMLVPVTLREDKGVQTTEIDLGEEPGAELGQVSTSADPRPKKFKTLLAKRYQRAPDPSPVVDAPEASGAGPWPIVAGGGALGALGLGIGLQVGGNTRGAVVSYGAGAALGGLAIYLLLRAGDSASDSQRIPEDAAIVLATPGGLGIGWRQRY